MRAEQEDFDAGRPPAAFAAPPPEAAATRPHGPVDGRPLRFAKDVDRAAVLVLVGVILLMPPVARIFVIDTRIADLPFTAVYLFAVWAVLILGAATMARRLRDRDEASAVATSGPGAKRDPDGAHNKKTHEEHAG